MIGLGVRISLVTLLAIATGCSGGKTDTTTERRPAPGAQSASQSPARTTTTPTGSAEPDNCLERNEDGTCKRAPGSPDISISSGSIDIVTEQDLTADRDYKLTGYINAKDPAFWHVAIMSKKDKFDCLKVPAKDFCLVPLKLTGRLELRTTEAPKPGEDPKPGDPVEAVAFSFSPQGNQTKLDVSAILLDAIDKPKFEDKDGKDDKKGKIWKLGKKDVKSIWIDDLQITGAIKDPEIRLILGPVTIK